MIKNTMKINDAVEEKLKSFLFRCSYTLALTADKEPELDKLKKEYHLIYQEVIDLVSDIYYFETDYRASIRNKYLEILSSCAHILGLYEKKYRCEVEENKELLHRYTVLCMELQEEYLKEDQDFEKQKIRNNECVALKKKLLKKLSEKKAVKSQWRKNESNHEIPRK